MDIINQVINSLSKEEIRYFKIFAKRMDTATERKDFLLLDYIRQSNTKYNEEKIARKLYGEDDKASFYMLKNRLLDYISDYLTFHHIWKSDSAELNRHLSVYSIFLRKGMFKVALFYLKKAENKAIKGEYFEMLDLIYGNFVKLSGDLPEINPEEYIQKRNENAGKLNKIRETDQAIAALSYRLKTTQNVVPGKTDTLLILNNTIREFTSDDTLKKSKSFQTRIYRAVSQVMLQQHNYPAFEVFLKQMYKRFETEKWFDRENHETKLQMLTYLVNSLFRNGEHNESLTYATILGTEINAFNGFLYDKYLFFYYNSLVINYSAIDRNKALATLEEFEKETKNKKNSYYDQFLYLNKAILLHQLNKPSDAIRNLVRLYINDNYKNADDSIKVKVAIAELIMQFDTGDFDSYVLRSGAIRRQFKKLLTTLDFKRELDLIRLMDKMAVKTDYKRDTKLKQAALNYVKEKVDPAERDSEIISYSTWVETRWKFKENK